MAKKRSVKCNGCDKVWSSGAKPEKLKCSSCKSVDILDNYVEPAKKIDTPAQRPTQVVLTNRQKKKRVFLGDSIRDENDTAFINKERRKREYKGRIIRITTVKEYEVSADGFLETEFVIELK